MRENSILNTIAKKEINTTELAKKIIKTPDLLPKILEGIYSTNPRIRFETAKALKIISRRNPEMLYSRMDFFVNLLDVENNILKWIAIDVIANLTAVDSRDEFNRLFNKYYSYLYEGSLITVAHVVDNSGRIAISKPELQDKITKELLKVEKIPLPTEECRNIIIGKAIIALQIYHDRIREKDKVISFVKRQVNNPRNATKTKAEKFLKKLEKQSKMAQKNRKTNQ